MLNHLLADFFERDLRKMIEELNLFKTEADLWKVTGTINNSAGNLALHIIGGMNHHIGTTLAGTGYLRNRDLEFSSKNIPRKDLTEKLAALIVLTGKTLNAMTPEQMEAPFPVFFDQPNTSTSYVLIQLSLHLNYHLGQVNYLRRMMETSAT